MSIYNGFTLNDQVIIVQKQQGMMYPQGYVVQPNNKKQLETALDWQSTWEKDANSNEYVKVHGEQFTYPNGKFKLKILKAPGRSCFNGKLSFSNCIITAPDNRKFIIGIDTDLLFNLLANSTVINGEVQNELYLLRKGGRVGALAPNTELFQQAQEDLVIKTQAKEIQKQNRKLGSSGFKPGFQYTTLQNDALAICKLYTAASLGRTIKIQYDDLPQAIKRGNYGGIEIYRINIENTLSERLVFMNYYYGQYRKTSDYFSNIVDDITKMINQFNNSMKENTTRYNFIAPSYSLIQNRASDVFSYRDLNTTLGSKKLGKQVIIDDLNENTINMQLGYIRDGFDKLLNILNKGVRLNSDLSIDYRFIYQYLLFKYFMSQKPSTLQSHLNYKGVSLNENLIASINSVLSLTTDCIEIKIGNKILQSPKLKRYIDSGLEY